MMLSQPTVRLMVNGSDVFGVSRMISSCQICGEELRFLFMPKWEVIAESWLSHERP